MKVSLLPAMRSVVLPSFLALLAAAPLHEAKADRGERGRDRTRHTTPAPARGMGEAQYHLNQYLYQGQRLDLVRTLGLRNRTHDGQQLLSIQVIAQSTQHRSSLKLIMNGQTVASSVLSPGMSLHVLTLPPYVHLQDLQLAVVGGAYLQTATTQTGYTAPPVPPRGLERLRVQVNQNYRGENLLPVRRLIANQYPGALQGKQLEKVVLMASSARGRARAQLVINGIETGMTQIVPMSVTRLEFDLPRNLRNVIGQDINTVQIKLVGNVFVEDLMTLTQSQSRRGHDQVLSEIVNRRFLGSHRVSLLSLLGQRRDIDFGSEVESVTIVSSGQGVVSLDARGFSQGSVRVLGSTGSTTIRVQDFASLSELGLTINGRIMVEQLVINFRPSLRRL